MTDLHLETLKHVKFTFSIHSDYSTSCHGYKSLCRMIEEEEKKLADQASLEAEPGYCKHCGTNPCKNEGLTMTLTDDDPDEEDVIPHLNSQITIKKVVGGEEKILSVSYGAFLENWSQFGWEIVPVPAPDYTQPIVFNLCTECGEMFCRCAAPKDDNQIKFP